MSKPMHAWFAECARCKRICEKANMQRIYVEKERYKSPTILCYLCMGCFCSVMAEWESYTPIQICEEDVR